MAKRSPYFFVRRVTEPIENGFVIADTRGASLRGYSLGNDFTRRNHLPSSIQSSMRLWLCRTIYMVLLQSIMTKTAVTVGTTVETMHAMFTSPKPLVHYFLRLVQVSYYQRINIAFYRISKNTFLHFIVIQFFFYLCDHNRKNYDRRKDHITGSG